MNSLNELGQEIYNEIINDPDFVRDVKKNFVITGEVYSADLNGNPIDNKRYAFVGSGCGITYLAVDKRSSIACKIDDCVRDVRQAVNEYLYNTFTEDEIKYYENLGSPVMAILQQDQQIQIEFYSRVVKIAKEKYGIRRITYRTFLD